MNNPINPHLGSVSAGTHRPEDLLPLFAAVLRDLIRLNTATLGQPDRIRLDTLADHAESALDQEDETLCDLFDALGEFAPEDHYFGAHPGDGADFGFWRDEFAGEPELAGEPGDDDEHGLSLPARTLGVNR